MPAQPAFLNGGWEIGKPDAVFTLPEEWTIKPGDPDNYGLVNAARLKDSGERNDVAAGMAKLLASEFCSEVTQQSFRIHGGYGYSKEYEIERLMRDAPFLLIGEGTSEIQKNIISKRLLADYRI